MVQSITSNIFYKTTDKIESNTLLNRGIVDVFGYAIPTALNANNKHEARERLTGSAVYFVIAFLSPLIMLPAFNKFFLKKAGIIDKFSDKGSEIVRLSKKHLVGTPEEMLKRIDELVRDLKNDPSKKTREKFKNVDKDFKPILEKFKGNENELREKLIKAHTKIAMSDYIATGAMLITACFGIKEITKKLTGRTGFSAEYEMADENYTKKNSQKHEQQKLKKIILSTAIMLLGSIGINKFVEKSFLKQSPNGLMKWIKNNADKFNYTGGIFMKMLPYALITFIGDVPAFIMSSRDRYERRDSTVRLLAGLTIFFGGDAVLNRMFGGLFDKIFKTKLVNKEGLSEKSSWWKKATAPIYSLEDLRAKTNWDASVLKRTQKFGIGMYWLNLALVTMILGVGLPKILNFVLRKSVNRDLSQKKPLIKE